MSFISRPRCIKLFQLPSDGLAVSFAWLRLLARAQSPSIGVRPVHRLLSMESAKLPLARGGI
jgi:hypothetical protein